MNAESMPLKHDHQQYGGADAPFRTMTKTTPTTRTTIVTRAIAVCVVVAAVAGVTYLSTGRYPRSPVALGATGGVLRDGSTSDNDTGHHDDETPTREAFIARYPELMDISQKDQTIQYEAYLLYLNGMTVKELKEYYHVNDDGQQDADDRGEISVLASLEEPLLYKPIGWFSCCKDARPENRRENMSKTAPSEGCMEYLNRCVVSAPGTMTIDGANRLVQCEFAGTEINKTCCRRSPNNRVGSKTFIFEDCT